MFASGVLALRHSNSSMGWVCLHKEDEINNNVPFKKNQAQIHSTRTKEMGLWVSLINGALSAPVQDHRYLHNA